MKKDFRQIHLLSPEVSNQIAAGEVVERPASVLKELVENSLDANATQIDVALENGGQTLVSVRDDGCGIPGSELELAITRHATSKISSISDLEAIRSYGFRGEALPSIASVSHFRIVSACREEQKAGKLPEGIATQLEINHGRIIGKKPATLPCGTLVEVRDLFSQLPARLKFLKNPATEQKRSQHWLARLALAHAEIGFSLSSGGRKILNFPKNQDLRQRLTEIWPFELTDNLIEFDDSMHGIRAYGLAAPPHMRLPRADRMYFYVNGRAVSDKRLLAAVKEAYKGRIIGRDYPQIVLFLEVDPPMVDVNAHPAKTEVRFRNESVVFSAIFGALGKCFQSSFITGETNVGFYADTAVRLYEPPQRVMPKPQKKPAPAGEWQVMNMPQNPNPPAGHVAAWQPAEARQATHLLAEATPEYGSATEKKPLTVTAESFAQTQPLAENFVYLGQALDTYLVLKDQKERLVLLDQHAAHERIIYERLSNARQGSPAQMLLVPLIFALSEEENGRICKLGDNLRRFGFNYTLKNKTLEVHAIPEFFSRTEGKEFIEDLLREKRETPEELFVTAACRSAIKAGQKLSLDEAMELLRQWQQVPNAEFCPHGRPCVLRWDAPAMEKLFKRRI